jgi:hypothetical protein
VSCLLSFCVLHTTSWMRALSRTLQICSILNSPRWSHTYPFTSSLALHLVDIW